MQVLPLSPWDSGDRQGQSAFLLCCISKILFSVNLKGQKKKGRGRGGGGWQELHISAEDTSVFLLAQECWEGTRGAEQATFGLLSPSVMSNSLQPHGLQLSRLPCPSPSPGVYSNSYPSSQWCHPITSSFIIHFPSCLQSFPASGSFPTSLLFPSGSQSIEASASVLPVNIQGWLPIAKSPCCPRDSQESFPHHNSEASILWCSAFFMVQLSRQYITTGKTIALTIGICKPSLCQRATPQDLWSLTPALGETGGDDPQAHDSVRITEFSTKRQGHLGFGQ